ncbi:hypothetical protein GW17_00017825 [Ensete ventricosum]|nr:hypothetical protein GW17_00017825 [Ensete ventricosum]
MVVAEKRTRGGSRRKFLTNRMVRTEAASRFLSLFLSFLVAMLYSSSAAGRVLCFPCCTLLSFFPLVFRHCHGGQPTPLGVNAEPYEMRISCGAAEDVTTKPTNTLWKKDFGYTGGKQANATIPSFIEPQLKTLRYFPLSDGPENCYDIKDIPRGHYEGTVLRTAKRLTCGTGKPAFDEDYGGSHWGGDRFWLAISSNSDSGQSIPTEHSISMTSISPNFYPEKLYQSAIVGSDLQPDLSFEMEVEPNQNYSVWLHFSEIDPRIAGEGERTFDISINGDIAFENIDIIGMTGGSYAALVLNTTVQVSGKVLTIVLRGTNGSHAIINAIEVFEVISAESKTSADEGKYTPTYFPIKFP